MKTAGKGGKDEYADNFSQHTEDEASVQAKAIMDQFKKDNPNAKKWVSLNQHQNAASVPPSFPSATAPASGGHGHAFPSDYVFGSAASNSSTPQEGGVAAAAATGTTRLTEHYHLQRSPKVTAHYADVSDPESVQVCIAEILAEHGKIDNLVTSAGFTENFQATDYPIDRMRKLFAVNVDGTYLFATSIARHLMERKARGSMVFIGSMSGAIVNVPQPQA